MSSKKRGGKSIRIDKDLVDLDPACIRFTHARIRPFFSGCGRRIHDTIMDLVAGIISVSDLPLITVVDNDGFYFSLNNRRLYVLKYLRDNGLLENNLVRVRLKTALARECTRYTIDRCSISATIMPDFSEGSSDRGDEDSCPVHRDDECAHIGDNEDGEKEKSGTVTQDHHTAVKSATTIHWHPEVMQSVTRLTLLVEKKKIRQVSQQIDAWMSRSLLTQDSKVRFEAEIGLI